MFPRCSVRNVGWEQRGPARALGWPVRGSWHRLRSGAVPSRAPGCSAPSHPARDRPRIPGTAAVGTGRAREPAEPARAAIESPAVEFWLPRPRGSGAEAISPLMIWAGQGWASSSPGPSSRGFLPRSAPILAPVRQAGGGALGGLAAPRLPLPQPRFGPLLVPTTVTQPCSARGTRPPARPQGHHGPQERDVAGGAPVLELCVVQQDGASRKGGLGQGFVGGLLSPLEKSPVPIF